MIYHKPVLGFAALATIGGYYLTEVITGLEGDYSMSVVESLIIGMIIHSLVHRSHGAGHQH